MAPRRNASTRLRFCASDPLCAISPNERAYEPPHPTTTATYCCPPTAYVIGAAMTPVCAGKDHSGAPLSAEYALKVPAAFPSKTRPPAVESTPPFQAPGCSTRQTSFWVTGSQAFR